MRHQPDHISFRIRDAGYCVDRAVRVVHIPEHHALLFVQLPERLLVAGVAALEMIDRNTKGSTHINARVMALRSVQTSTSTGAQMKRRPRFFCRAPGSIPASVSTWKPLQIPTTGPPPAAKRCTASMTGENRARAPGLR